MANSNDWLPSRLADVAVVMQNILVKIPSYEALHGVARGVLVHRAIQGLEHFDGEVARFDL